MHLLCFLCTTEVKNNEKNRKKKKQKHFFFLLFQQQDKGAKEADGDLGKLKGVVECGRLAG